MLKNYLRTAYRNLLRNKGYATINVVGLAVGVAACLLIFIVIRFESSFDNFHVNSNRIYRVASEFNTPEGKQYSSGSPQPVAEALRIDFPQLEAVANIRGGTDRLISLQDEKGTTLKKFKEDRGVFVAEPQFFQIFNFPWLAGDPKTALSAPNTGVLTKETAERYFGDWKEAMGKTIMQDNKNLIKITGILADVPANTDFPLKVVISYETFKRQNPYAVSDWVTTSSNSHCYAVLPKNLSQATFNAQLQGFVKKHKPIEYQKDKLIAQPLSDIHYDERFGNFQGRTFGHELIKVLTLIGIFLLVIACVNFINLATAQAVNRSKEVGVRKVLGSRRSQLISQFMGETALITLMAILLAVGLAIVLLPALRTLLDVPLRFPLDSTVFVFLLFVFLTVTFVSGFYPALVLSGFNPINALKNKVAQKQSGGLSLRRALVVLQFCIAQVLIIGVLVVVKQMAFFRNASLGFDKDAIIQVAVDNDSSSVSKYAYLRQQLSGIPGVKECTFSFASPASAGGWYSDFKYNGSTKNTDFGANLKWADTAYFHVYGLQFIAGRPYRFADTANEVVVNETLLHKLGIRNPQDILNKKLDFWNGRKVVPVVGVVKDFHSLSLREPITPVVLGCWNEVYQTIGIKVKPQGLKQTLAAVEQVWMQTFPQYLYEYEFLDERISNFYRQEAQLATLYKLFAALAIFISCLGLYGLVSFMAVQRTKEVGIRKVLGASVRNIIVLFSKEFTVLVSIAFLVAAPIAYYFMKQWLENFTFRVDFGIGLFVSAITISLLIAWITVSYKAIKAARANPVKNLRTE